MTVDELEELEEALMRIQEQVREFSELLQKRLREAMRRRQGDTVP